MEVNLSVVKLETTYSTSNVDADGVTGEGCSSVHRYQPHMCGRMKGEHNPWAISDRPLITPRHQITIRLRVDNGIGD